MEGFTFPAMKKKLLFSLFLKAFILRTNSVLTQMEIVVKSQTL